MLYGNVSAVAGVNMCGYDMEQSDLPSPANDNSTVVVKQKTVSVQRTLDKSGLSVTVQVPVGEFHGIVVATRISEEGVLTSELELVHEDEALSHKIYSEDGNATIVAEWQARANEYGLPMFIRAGSGDLVPFTQKVEGIAGAVSTPRRKLAAQANRRPRFNHKRK